MAKIEWKTMLSIIHMTTLESSHFNNNEYNYYTGTSASR